MLNVRSDRGGKTDVASVRADLDTTMATGQLSKQQLIKALTKQGVSSAHGTEQTLYATFVPEHRAPGSRPPDPPPKRLPEPDPADRSSENLAFSGKLAEGGMGEILLASQSGIRREVAVKTLKSQFLETSFATRLLREARVLGLLEHPNIVPLYGLQTDERNAPALVMKRIEGVSWRTLMRDPEASPIKIEGKDELGFHLDVFLRVCDAVRYAHSRGVLHLDLKPDNVMLGSFREVYLVDWGVAVSVSEKHRGWLPMADEVTEIIGTPAYLAPEMVPIDGSTIDRRSDVYLLGGILFELLTKDPPHKGKSLHEVLLSAQKAEAPVLPKQIPGELRRIVQKAMHPLQSERHETVAELQRAVADFVTHRSALELANSAWVALDTLRGLVASQSPSASGHRIRESLGEDEQEVLRLFGRCRYGFAESLRQWPESRSAMKGKRELLTLMAEYHLERGEAASAEALLEELEVSFEKLDTLRKEATRQRQEAAKRERLEREESPEEGQAGRGRITLVVGGVTALLSLGGWIGQRVALYEYAWWHTVVFTAATLGAAVVLGYLMRGDLLANRRGKRITWSMLVTGVMALGLRLLITHFGLTGLDTLAFELGVLAGSSAIVGLLADSRILRVAPVFATFSALCVVAPAHALLWNALAACVGAGVLGTTWLKAAE